MNFRLQEYNRDTKEPYSSTIKLLASSNAKERVYKMGTGEEFEVELFEVPPHSIPIRCDVRYLDWDVRHLIIFFYST